MSDLAIPGFEDVEEALEKLDILAPLERKGRMREIDELRNAVDDGLVSVHDAGKAFGYLNGIEAALAERYVELPTDADGKPWHIGDMVSPFDTGETGRVTGIEYRDGRTTLCIAPMGRGYEPGRCSHAVPTLAERISRVADEINAGEYSEQRSHWVAELADIADELEGEGE